ncbi:energy transducer TonB [Parasulfuritortus cantonensis]|uniref:Energy transducer TonB n=2 Tax=Parasulfuritortus cantonensis TaxID=2528202 RepID=A0A4R1BCK2_9PROT|nr:energy transducer TonB [Parasulfuritortus cantonensis]
MSAIIHTTIIFGVGIKAANPELFETKQPLEVVLVNARSKTRPLQADVLAQANLDGGGDVEEEHQAKTPLVASPRNAQAATNTLDSQVKALETQARQLMTQAKSDYGVTQKSSEPPAPDRQTAPAPYSLAEASLEMARLQARISTEWDAYQKRPRRDNSHARAQEYPFARYAEDWRLKVERIGNLNYPEAAKRAGIHGHLVLTVSINSDGSLDNVQVDRSSGSRILDAAAVRIVEMAAPFPPFSEDMRKKVDIYEITRGWEFTTSDRLSSE